MPLRINSKHSSRHNSIEELYQESLNECKEYKEYYIAMIEFASLITRMFTNTDIWALTSVDRLVLMTEDDYQAAWYIIIASDGTGKFHFEYLVPKEKRPWEHAYMTGEANSLDEAKVYLLKSMKECGGWSGSEELKLYCENLT